MWRERETQRESVSRERERGREIEREREKGMWGGMGWKTAQIRLRHVYANLLKQSQGANS